MAQAVLTSEEIRVGMREKAREFSEKGGEVYAAKIAKGCVVGGLAHLGRRPATLCGRGLSKSGPRTKESPMHRRLAWLVPAVLAAAPLAPSHAQSPNERARSLAADFTKSKDATKRKHGVVLRKYREIVAVPWVVGRVAEYVGHYVLQDEPESTLTLRLDERGQPAGFGRDAGGAFELRDARIGGGMLTSQKVYGDGQRLPFEAAFLRRSERDDPSQPYRTTTGIGFVAAAPPGSGVAGPLRFFLVKQP